MKSPSITIYICNKPTYDVKGNSRPLRKVINFVLPNLWMVIRVYSWWLIFNHKVVARMT